MRLKKIELSGFKSFADRQVVHVDDRITGVIGPNGCGKSNIVDAVRWAMGEQRAKHLRGAGMADVIFAGCATRGPAASAEVTLTFANDGHVPPGFADYAEIAITRRLYADGTSEYLINKVPARLRDIQELLLGTGAGTRGYSIIEQGQVGKIVTSKPEERRHIIDEAAGITRFKAQKAAAEKKIAGTQQNLMRVRDVIGELEGRIGTLAKQAQKAERYKRYRAELVDLELWMASHRFLELLTTGAVLGARRDEVARDVDDLRRATSARDAAIEAKRIALKEVEELLSQRQAAVYELDGRVARIEAEVQFRERERDAMRVSAEQSRKEATTVAEAIVQLEADLEGVDAKLAELGDARSPDGAQAQVERLTQQQSEAAGAAGRSRAALEQLRREQSKLQAELAAAQARRQTLADGMAELEGTAATRAAELEQLRRELDDERARVTEHERIAAEAAAAVEAARAHKLARDRDRVALREQLRAAEVHLDTRRAELQRAKSRLQSLQEIEQRYRGCTSGVQVVMAHRAELAASSTSFASAGSEAGVAAAGGSGGAPVHGILADFVRAPAHLESAVSAVLGDRLQGIVVEQPDVGAAGVDLLKDKREGRTTFLPRQVRARPGAAHAALAGGWAPPRPADLAGGRIEVEDRSTGELPVASAAPAAPTGEGVLGRLADLVEVTPAMAPLARELLGDTLVVDQLTRALELWHGGAQSAAIVTLDGDRLEPNGVLVGGSSDALDSALLQQKREIRELEAVVAALTEEFDGARATLEAVSAQLAEVEAAREAAEAAVLEAEKTKVARHGSFTAAQRAIEGLARRVAAGDADAAQAGARLIARRAELASLDTKAEAATARAPELEAALTAAAAAAEHDAAEAARLGEALTDAKVALARWRQQIEGLQGTRTRVHAQLGSERQRERRLLDAAVTSEGKAAENEQLNAASLAERGELIQRSKAATAAVHDARERFDALRLEVDELELAMKNLRSDLELGGEQLRELEFGLRELTIERDHLVADVAERFDLALHEVVIEHHHRRLAGPEERERAKELKKVIARMGEVNLTAIEEYEQVKARYEYLTAQRGDLEQAITQLQEAIDRINRTTRQRFKETFDLVNAKFQEVFPRLFAGGRAELKLTHPDDLLETGVEISAQPPGKQLRSLELLSGGEKALTATSLIFAIFLIKPSPFCLLDEVDAPLDEANVDRFCNLVRELSEQTQFVMITHNKRTMEAADRLYGVTMEQRGVSKLVSVNMRRAIELAMN